MITPEKVCEVFGITSKYIRPESVITVCPITEYEESKSYYHPKSGMAHVFKSSPKILVALINMVINYQNKYYGNVNLNNSIKAIESADSKNRKWSELLKALEE